MASIEQPPLNEAVAQLLAMVAGERMTKSEGRGGSKIRVDLDIEKQLKKQAKDEEKPTLEKAIMKSLNQQGEVERLAFEVDPLNSNRYASIYKMKTRLIPDKMLKRIAIQDDLVAAIIQARQNQMSAFGRPRPDRFSTGFIIEPRQYALEQLEKIKDPEEKKVAKDEMQRRIAATTKRIMSCGDDGLDLGGVQDKLTFPQYISMSIRNAVLLGRLATEVLNKKGLDGNPVFAGIRVIDAATIYRAEPQQEAAEQVRRTAARLMSQIKNEKIDPQRFERDEYAWIQVIDDRPVQAFTDKECLVHNFFPVPDIELDGYPVTPIDTVISAVTTHINITTHNKVYFQSGRATRGMLVIKSDDVDETIIQRVRQQFNAQINSVQNAWRMPVFGVGQQDEIQWQPIDASGGGRDMEFQYLTDMNARVIMSAFMMSPEELPGWSYLSRGTNNQSMSEGNNEYKLEAARDLGIRPLLAQFEDFLNQEILPLFDKGLSESCALKLVGLDSETAEKESVRIQQDMPVHMTFDEVLEKVEKKAIGKRLGGEYPLNPQYQAVLDKFVPVGFQLENFFGVEGAAQDEQWNYVRDPFWFQKQQLIQAQQQAQAQAQQQQAQAQQQQQGGGDPNAQQQQQGAPQEQSPTGEAAKPSQGQNATENQKSQAVAESSASAPSDLTRSIDQAIGLLSKSEAQLPPSKRLLLTKQKRLIAEFLKHSDDMMKASQKDILEIAEKLAPKAKK